jgi:hypothetical protein
MKWAIFADLPRVLCRDEQTRITDALDLVGGGCVGPNRGGKWEVFFALQANDQHAARERGRAAMTHALQRAGIDIDFAISVQAVAA